MFKIRQRLELILKSLKLSWVGDQEKKAMVGAGVFIVFQAAISHFIIFARKHSSPKKKTKNQQAIYLIIRDSNGTFCKLEGLNIKLYKRK